MSITGEGGEVVEVQPVLVDTQAAAAAVQVEPVTVRSWAHRGKLERKGTGKGNRALWDLEQVYAAAAAESDGRASGGTRWPAK